MKVLLSYPQLKVWLRDLTEEGIEPQPGPDLTLVRWASHELEYSKLGWLDAGGLCEVAPIQQLGEEVALIAVPAGTGDAGGGAVLCSIALHSDGDRGDWTDEYVQIQVRCVPLTALVEMIFLSELEDAEDIPVVYFDAAGGRWPFGDALGSVAVDAYAASVNLVGLEGLLQWYGVDPVAYNGDEEAEAADEVSGVGPAIDTLTGFQIPEFTADSGGDRGGGVAALVQLPLMDRLPGRARGAAATVGPFDGLRGLAGGKRPSALRGARGAAKASAKAKPSTVKLAEQMDLLMDRLASLEMGGPGQTYGRGAYPPPAAGRAGGAGAGGGGAAAGGGSSWPRAPSSAFAGASPKAVTFRGPPIAASRSGSFVPGGNFAPDRDAAMRTGQRLFREGPTGRGRGFVPPAWPSASAAAAEAEEGASLAEGNVAGGFEPTLASALQELAQSLKAVRGPRDSDYGFSVTPASTVEEAELLMGGAPATSGASGAAGLERLKLTMEKRPDLILLAFERSIKKTLGVLPGEAWTVQRHAKEQVMPAAGNHGALKRTILILAHLLDLARTEEPARAFAFAAQAYKAAHAAALHPSKEWRYGWPLLNLEEPDMPARVPYTPGEFAALASWHKDAAIIEKAMGGTPWTGGTSSDRRDEPRGDKKSRGKGRGKGEDAAPSADKGSPGDRGPPPAGRK